MKIAVLGNGKMGRKLAQIWQANGHEVRLGSRQPEQAEPLAGVPLASIVDAAEWGEVVAFAFPWYALVDIQREVGKLAGKIIIDCINPMMSSGSLAVGHKWSAGEEIARTFPLAQVVKAFNGIYYENLDQPLFDGRPASLFYCSDADAAKTAVVQLATEMGFAPVDCGPIKHARYLEPLAVLWLQMAFHMGMGSEMAFMLAKRSDNKRLD